MKIYVTDFKFGDFHKYGPFETVRIDSVSDDSVTLLCDEPHEKSSLIIVSYGMVISVEEEEE